MKRQGQIWLLALLIGVVACSDEPELTTSSLNEDAAAAQSAAAGGDASDDAADGLALAPQDMLSVGTADEVDIDTTLLLAAAKVVSDAVDKDEIRGAVVLIVRHRKIVLHEAYGWRDLDKKQPMKKDSLFQMASNTKALTAAGVLSLVDDGKVNLDDAAFKYLTAFQNLKSANITIRQLLTHTAGLRIKTLFKMPLMEKSAEHPDAPTLLLEVDRLADVGPEVKPGTTFSYNNAGYNILAGVVEKLTGSYKKHLHQRFYEPLGMTDSSNHESDADQKRMSAIFEDKTAAGWKVGWKPGDPSKFPFARGSGGMISSAMDFAIFCQTLLNGGTYGGKRVLSKALVKQAVNPQSKYIKAAGGYGLGWAVQKAGAMASHSGSDGTYAWMDPKRKVVGLLLTQSPGGKIPRVQFRKTVNAACDK